VEEFNFDHRPSADRNLIAYLGTGVLLSEAKDVVPSDHQAPAKHSSRSASASKQPKPGTGSS
jgi:hypothetical protein